MFELIDCAFMVVNKQIISMKKLKLKSLRDKKHILLSLYCHSQAVGWKDL